AAGRERRKYRAVRGVLQEQRAGHGHAALERTAHLRRRERLAAQDAVLVGERKPHGLQAARLDLLQDAHAACCDQRAWRRRVSSARRQYSSIAPLGPMPSIAGGPVSSFALAASSTISGRSPASFLRIASTSSRRYSTMPLSAVPRFSRVRSAIGPCDSQAHWSWMLMSKPMPVKVCVRCCSASKPQPFCLPKMGLYSGAGYVFNRWLRIVSLSTGAP